MTRRQPLLSILRRSTRLAAFALVVFVLRLGMVAACVPADLAEDLSMADRAGALHLSFDGGNTDSDTNMAHASGHCLHCGCHLPAALPEASGAQVVATSEGIHQASIHAPPDVPPGRELRPPIA
jgi:hypothetical protein